MLDSQLNINQYSIPDLKLFAHIHNDSTLSTSKLQGHTFDKTIGYLSSFLSRLVQGKITVEGSTPQGIKNLAQIVRPLFGCFKDSIDFTLCMNQHRDKINEAINKEHLKLKKNIFGSNLQDYAEIARVTSILYNKAFKELSEKTYSSLKTNKRAIIPGGWLGSHIFGPGHAMLYEFKVNDQGEIIFIVWNTGAGIKKNHQSIEHGDEAFHYSPVKVFRCAKFDELDQNIFENFVQTLIKPNLPAINPLNTLTEKEIYSQVISEVAQIEGVETNPDAYCKSYSQPQISGTCAWKVLEAFIKNEISQELDFDLIHLEILTDSLKSFTRNEHDNIQNDDGYQRELKLALEHYALRIKTLSEINKLSQQKQNEALKLIESAKTLLKPKEDLNLDQQSLANQLRFLPLQDHTIEPCNIYVGSPQDYKRHEMPTSKQADFKRYTLNDNATIDNAYQIINQLLDLKDKDIDNTSKLRAIEAFISSIPLTEAFVKKSHNVLKSDFALSLQKLVSFYTSSCNSQFKAPFAKRQVNLYACVALMELLVAEKFSNQPEVIKNIFAKERVDNKIPPRHLNFIKAQLAHQFTLTESSDAEKLKQVNKILARHETTDKEMSLHYFAELVCQIPEVIEKSAIEPNSNKNKLLIAYDFYHKKEEIKSKINAHAHDDTNFAICYEAILFQTESYVQSCACNTNKDESFFSNQLNIYFKVDDNKNIKIAYANPFIAYNRYSSSENDITTAYTISDKNISNDLTLTRQNLLKTPNEIQIKIHSKNIDEAIDLRRVINQLGVSSGAQVVACIEFLKSNSTNMQNKDIQTILFMYLFEKHYLFDEIKQNVGAIKQLLDVIEIGIHYYSHDGIEQPSAFYLMLNTFLRKSMISANQNVATNPELTSLIKRSSNIQKYLERFTKQLEDKNNLSSKESHVLYEFNVLKINEIYNKLKLNNTISQQEIINFYLLNFKITKYKSLLNEPQLFLETDNTINDIKKYLVDNPKLTNRHIMISVIEKLGLNIDVQDLQFDFPSAKSANQSIDFISGIYYDNNNPSIDLPNKLYQNEIFKSFFGYDDIVATKCGYDRYKFNYKNETYYIHYSEYVDLLNIKKQMATQGMPLKTYELVNDLDSCKLLSQLIPTTLLDKNHNIWVSEDKDIIITNAKTKQQEFFFNSQTKKGFLLDDAQQPYETLLPISCFERNGAFEYIAKFESKYFIQGTYDEQQEQYKIVLPRYGLSFISEKDNEQIKFKCKQFPDYYLINANHTPVKNFDNGLILAHKNNQADRHIFKNIIPQQGFYYNNQVENQYPGISLDINANIDIAEMIQLNNSKSDRLADQKIKNKGVSVSEISSYRGNTSKVDFSRSQKFVELTYHNNALQISSAEDAFYLATLHLAKREPNKALELLKAHGHRFTGGIRQLDILRQMITDIPSQAYGDNRNEQEINTNPMQLAVRTYALNIINQFQQQGNNLAPLVSDVNSNELSKAKAVKLRDFIKDFNKITKEHLCRYLSYKTYVPKRLRLSRTVELSLLEQIKSDKRLLIEKVQKKRDKLKGYEKEYHSLLHRKSQLSQKDSKRLQSLIEKLGKSYEIYGIDETSQRQHMTLTVPSYITFGTDDKKSDKDIKIDELNAMTSPDDVCKHYISLFKEACASKKQKNKLVSYLNGKLYIATANQHAKQHFNWQIYSLLRAMIADEKKSSNLIKEFTNRQDKYQLLPVQDVHGNTHQFYDLNRALNHAFKNQQVAFDVSTVEKQLSKKPTIVKANVKSKTSIHDEPLNHKVEIDSLESILIKLNLSKSLRQYKKEKLRSSKDIFESSQHEGSDFYGLLINESNQDFQAGDAHNQKITNQNAQIQSVLNSSATRNRIRRAINEALENNIEQFDTTEAEILKLLSKGPKAPKAQKQWQISLENGSRRPLTLDDAFKFFSKGCLSQIQEKCQIEPSEAQTLFNLTKQYLVNGCSRKHYARILELLDGIDRTHQQNKKETLVNRLGHELTLRRSYDINRYRDILLFEYVDDKLVYANQIKMLEKLLAKDNGSFVNTVIQLIMGGGKSKVLLPLLAKIRADGTNLTIIEVPSALLETNFNDLFEISNKLNQKANLFKFNRNLETDSNYFYRLRQQLRSVVTNKQYIVTTRESIQSLELKYIDLITTPQENLDEWLKQIHYLDDIINLVKNQGDAIIDEIDLNLKTKDQLIYTVGDGQGVPRHAINAIMDLYQFFENIEIKDNHQTYNLHDVVSLNIAKPNEEILDKLIEKLRAQLISSKQSPIHKMVSHLKPNEIRELDTFLKNEGDEIPQFISDMPLKEKTRLAIYKEHLNKLLNISLKRKLYENFGLSQDKQKTGMAKEIAIPYVSNNTPNESARFQNHFLTINYTIQTHLAQSLSPYIFDLMLKDFKKRLIAETNLNAYAKTSRHEVEPAFKALFGDTINLHTFDVNDKDTINNLHQNFKDDLNVKQFSLSKFILPSILSNPLTLTSNSQNHVQQYRSVVGFTGTDYNFRCFHDSIKRDNEESFGTDGQTISHLLNKEGANNQPTHVLDSSEPNALIDLLNHHDQLQDVRAIIDVGAQFKGIKNRDVATQLATFYANSPENPGIKYILYFNKDNLLCALPVCQNPQAEQSIVLSSSEAIEKKLGCEQHEYFSYYDQAHTTGTDIKQAPNTIGLVTISEKVLLRDLLQAVMRLRDLKGSHFAELVVMKSLVAEHPEVKQWDVKSILNICLNYQSQTLMKEHLGAAFQKIHNTVRSEFMKQIRKAPSSVEKLILGDAFKKMLYNLESQSIFEMFATIESLVNTSELLNDYKKTVIDKLQECMATANRTIDDTRMNKINKKIDRIIKKSLKICEKKQISPIRNGSDNTVIAQQEVHNEQENEKENQNQAHDANYKAKGYQSWKHINFKTFAPNGYSVFGLSFMTLEDIAQKHNKPRSWRFDGNIHVSENFYNTCWMPFSDKINTLKKPLFYTLAIQDGNQSTKVLITQQEAEEIRNKINETIQPNNRYVWVETQSGVPYAGLKPKETLLSTHESQMEQIKYFNADVVYLAGNHDKLQWLKQDTKNKLDYLESEILRLHPSKGGLMTSLRAMLCKENHAENTKSKHQTVDAWGFDIFNDIYHRLFYHSAKYNYLKKEDYQKLRAYYWHRKGFGIFSLSKIKEYKKDIFYAAAKGLKWLGNKFFDLVVNDRNIKYIEWFARKSYMRLFIIPLMSVVTLCTLSYVSTFAFNVFLWANRVYVLRAVFGAYAKQKYNTINKVKKLSNSWEVSALNDGLESGTMFGYVKSFVKPLAYVYPRAYYGGLEISYDNRESILSDEIRNHKLR